MVAPEEVELVAIAAVADNGVIGDDGELPWDSIPEDRRQYRDRVAGHPVILGRRTYELMRDDLPGNAQIVLSRHEQTYDVDTAHHAGSVAAAREAAADLGAESAYVIGGAEIYELFFPNVERLFLSRIPGAYDGDTVFPDWDESDWRLVAEVEYDAFTLQEWVRASGV